VFAGFGPTELIIVLVIVLLIFGPKRLPGLGKSLGSGMREFKDSITGKDDEDEQRERERTALERPAAEPAAPVATPEATATVRHDTERERTPQS
jgi:sec-independent protein translocase protein TatA